MVNRNHIHTLTKAESIRYEQEWYEDISMTQFSIGTLFGRLQQRVRCFTYNIFRIPMPSNNFSYTGMLFPEIANTCSTGKVINVLLGIFVISLFWRYSSSSFPRSLNKSIEIWEIKLSCRCSILRECKPSNVPVSICFNLLKPISRWRKYSVDLKFSIKLIRLLHNIRLCNLGISIKCPSSKPEKWEETIFSIWFGTSNQALLIRLDNVVTSWINRPPYYVTDWSSSEICSELENQASVIELWLRSSTLTWQSKAWYQFRSRFGGRFEFISIISGSDRENGWSLTITIFLMLAFRSDTFSHSPNWLIWVIGFPSSISFDFRNPV